MILSLLLISLNREMQAIEDAAARELPIMIIVVDNPKVYEPTIPDLSALIKDLRASRTGSTSSVIDIEYMSQDEPGISPHNMKTTMAGLPKVTDWG